MSNLTFRRVIEEMVNRGSTLCVIAEIYQGNATVSQKRLNNSGISAARQAEITAARVADAQRDWTIVPQQLPRDGPVNVHDFCHWLYHNDRFKKSEGTLRVAYGDWRPEKLAESGRPPRTGNMYLMLSAYFGGGDPAVDGKYGLWENDVRPAFDALDSVVQTIVDRLGLDKAERHLQHISTALELAECFDHVDQHRDRYARLQKAKISAEMAARLRRIAL